MRTKLQADPDSQVLQKLSKLRPKIRRAKATLDALYREQNGLYVEGHEAGIPIALMARAGGDKYEVGEQSVRQIIRRVGDPGYDPENGYRKVT